MKLADLQLAMELQGALARLDEIAGPGAFELGDRRLEFTADEIAAFVDWRRADLHRQLRQLGVEPEGAPAPEPLMPDGAATARLVHTQEVAGVSPAPATSTGQLSRAEALEEARRRVMGRIYDEWQAGQLDDPGEADPRAAGNLKFAELCERRQGLIDDLAAQLMAPPVVTRCEWHRCQENATTIVAGVALCEAHAAQTPRAEQPLRLVR